MRLILFDIDGTLLRTQGVGRQSTKDAMLEIFGTTSTIDTHTFGGKTDWFTLAELLKDHGWTAETIGQKMADYEKAIALHLKRIIGPHNAAALPGALEIVAQLRQDPDIILGIVTGNCASTAPLKIQAAGFDPAWFPVGAFGSESIDRNDLPKLALQRALDHSGLEIAPEDVIVIGDTPADVTCARALGAVAVAVCTGSSSREELLATEPDHLLDDLTQLAAIL